MKMPARIQPWLSPEEMAQWVREADRLDAFKKRLAVWMTLRGSFHAGRISDLLQISKQSVWTWVKLYNLNGPKGLERKVRGGRRRAYLSEEEERALVSKLQELVASGQARRAKELLPEVLKAVRDQSVSVTYVYRLLQRHQRSHGLRALAILNDKIRKEMESRSGAVPAG